jgi:2-methylcitrate dehydratase PrpD
VAIAGTQHDAGRILVDLVDSAGGNPQARVLGTATVSSALEASWANGSLSHLLDFDDTGFSHPTACILPSCLAIAELRNSSGTELVEALVIGYEVFERLAASARASEPLLRRRGLHPTSIWGSPAAAAAASRLLGLDVDQTVIAFGISASAASGLTQQFGSWSKGLNAGNAARSGVQAALLAERGYRGNPKGISGDYGLFSAMIGDGNFDFSGVSVDLGKRWSILDPGISIKPYPACTSTLRAVDAMLLITQDEAYSSDKVRKVEVHVHPDLLHTLRFRAPTDGFSGKFSLDYTVAAAAVDGELTLRSFDEVKANRRSIRDMLDRVELVLHPEWDISRRHENPVVVELDDGTTLEENVPAHKGSRAWPLSEEEIDAKFVECVRPSLGETDLHSLVRRLRTIDREESVRAVLDDLTLSTVEREVVA